VAAGQFQSKDKKMSFDEFTARLKELNLKKIRFAELTGMKQKTVLGWGQGKVLVPSWVDSWLENYEYAIKYKKIIENI
jgi:DNA-binding transcriptional regulator YiaG